jgi:hypothetical protein
VLSINDLTTLKMKNMTVPSLTVVLLGLLLATASCEKRDAFVPGNEIPSWLKDEIEGYRQALQQNPKNPVINGIAWIRYKWENEYYFEFRSMISSTFAYPISFNQDTLKVCPVCLGTEYHDNKCCKQYVWKGSIYADPGD